MSVIYKSHVLTKCKASREILIIEIVLLLLSLMILTLSKKNSKAETICELYLNNLNEKNTIMCPIWIYDTVVQNMSVKQRESLLAQHKINHFCTQLEVSM